MRERIIYECEHCHKKRLLSKYQMKEHEEKCFYNPNVKACITCRNFYYESAYLEPHFETTPTSYEEVEEVRSCEVGQDIKFKLKSKCANWIPKIEEEVM